MSYRKIMLPVAALALLAGIAASVYVTTSSDRGKPAASWPWATDIEGPVISVFTYAEAQLHPDEPDHQWHHFVQVDALTLVARSREAPGNTASGRIAFKAAGLWYFGTIRVDCNQSRFAVANLSAWQDSLLGPVKRVPAFTWPPDRAKWQQGDVEEDTVLQALCQRQRLLSGDAARDQ